jgi:carboxymethylenebutenolidase
MNDPLAQSSRIIGGHCGNSSGIVRRGGCNRRSSGWHWNFIALASRWHRADDATRAAACSVSGWPAGGPVPDIATKSVLCAGGLPAFLATPATSDRKVPAIVLMHERYGLVQHTRDLAARFARDGFVCLAPDFFHKHPDQEALHRGDAGYPLDDTEAVELLEAAIVELVSLPQVDREKIAVKGVCQTGRHPLVLAAEKGNIAAALVWYGAANAREWQPSERYKKPLDDMLARLDCPVLGIFGEADHLISLADVRRFRDSLERHDKTYTIKVFAGAPHGWLNDTMPGRYRREAAESAWTLQLAFLRRVFDPGYDKTRRVQVYECDYGADYDFKKNVRME